MDLLINPPTSENSNKETYTKYEHEVDTIKDDLKAKAKAMSKKLDSMKYFTCNEIEGKIPKINFY